VHVTGPRLKKDSPFNVTEAKPGSGIYIVERLLSEEECITVMQGTNGMKPAMVIDANGDESVDLKHRKCQSGHYEEPWLLDRVKLAIDWNCDVEKFSVMKYGPGDFFRPHSDRFHHTKENNRIATLIIYLSTPVSGGDTIFPKRHIKIPAVQGNAVFFTYDNIRQEIHAGSPIKEGEKWISTLWFRDHAST
jgi:prolyl 4-hydroxylase